MIHFILCTCLSFIALILLRRKASSDDVHRLPSPSSSISHWLFGHELLVFKHDASQMYHVWARSFGRLFRIKAALFHPDMIIVTDHKAVQHIFANIDRYGKDPSFRQIIAHSVGKGVVWAEGEEYVYQKRLLLPAFTAETVKVMAQDVVDCAEELESKLSTYVNLHSIDGRSVLMDVVDQCSACALDIFGRVGLCHNFDAIKSMPISSNHTSVKISTRTDATSIILAWSQLIHQSRQVSVLFARALFRMLPILAELPFPGLKSVSSQTIQRLTIPLLEKAKADADNKGTDILSILAREGTGLTQYQIIQNMSTLLSAGHETVAGSVSFILWELARHPGVQNRLRQELYERGHSLTYDNIQKLEYLDAVVKEGFRIHPASPLTERMAFEDDVLLLSAPIQGADGTMIETLHIKKGQVFIIPFEVINTNEAVWGPDGVMFRPERWLMGTGVDKGGIPAPADLPQGWSGITSFCDGPRQCLGLRLGVFEVKVIVATLVRSLEFRTTGKVVRTVPLPTLQPVVDDVGGSLPLVVLPAPAL